MSLPLGRPCMGSLRRNASPVLRSFSTSGAKLQDVPPDSPLYIRLPMPPQTEEKKRERVRGFLPVPREIFARKDGERKLDPEYLKKTAPEPRLEKTGSVERQWKASLANSRRQGLEEGLNELWKRHSRDTTTRDARSRARFWENHRLAVAPEREDDRATRGTTLDSLLDTKVYADPDRFSRADRSRDKVLALQNAKREARRDALMELYISASNFITTESELREAIETTFSEDHFTKKSQEAQRWGAANAWGIHGPPPSVASMLAVSTRASTRLVDDQSEWHLSTKRQKRIAEEFTGGKMEQ
ncbi:hypothetical protein ACRE_082390 [Hapsidospora chrysogenum ATCC 11550]|uniref:Uncharacterized protein n=1 Tax=Hapsidospora chrysogenum (strain ATCC 11550 / CBS 779.69 / DSM 880 / IAM 14645 / JCM 23072 / IMI 49137) TaxID=857340 RepID=A0A086SVC8_HAPC1|nr:hypothetical protein ACRE_082390 [Hapsidospora chrysogenum ATCC 11550]